LRYWIDVMEKTKHPDKGDKVKAAPQGPSCEDLRGASTRKILAVPFGFGQAHVRFLRDCGATKQRRKKLVGQQQTEKGPRLDGRSAARSPKDGGIHCNELFDTDETADFECERGDDGVGRARGTRSSIRIARARRVAGSGPPRGFAGRPGFYSIVVRACSRASAMRASRSPANRCVLPDVLRRPVRRASSTRALAWSSRSDQRG
jgi:hypothetical protein